MVQLHPYILGDGYPDWTEGGSRELENRPHSGYILEADLTDFADREHMKYEREVSRTTPGFGLSDWKKGWGEGSSFASRNVASGFRHGDFQICIRYPSGASSTCLIHESGVLRSGGKC